MKSKRILIVELGEKAIKATESIVSKRKSIILRFETEDIAGISIQENIETLFQKFSKSKYENIIFSLPRSFFLIRFVKLPSQDSQEIRKMFPFQLAKIVPHSLDEVIYDFSVVETKDGIAKLLVFLVQKKKVSALREFIEKKEITPSRITITSWGLEKWFFFQKRFLKGVVSWPVALIDIDKYCADVVALGKEGMMFSRSFSYAHTEELLKGIHQSLKVFGNEFGALKFSKVVFTGSRNEDIMRNANLGDSTFLNPWEGFTLHGKAKEKATKSAFSFASMLGLTTEREVPKFDFSFEFVKKGRADFKRKKRLLDIAVVGLEILFIAGIFSFKYVFDKFSYLKFLNSKLNEIKLDPKELDRVANKLKILDNALKNKTLFSELLYATISSITKNTQLTLLDFQENGNFSLTGYAHDIADVFKIVSSLNNHELFKEVKVKHASTIKRKNKSVVEFYIYGEIKL
ncbi:MAG: PilN domain-containing protein [Candidatus Omnitrophota bacterium]|nr:MAG: PilN domain-containing protein [Candidatus Omnitrophota bacterium]